MSETKITTATVSVTLSHFSNYFKVELGIENEDGITDEEIIDYRIKANNMAIDALDDHKLFQETESIKRKSKKDNTSIADIEALPLYADIKKRAQEQKAKKDAKN